LEHATPATTDDNLLPFAFPAVERKEVTAASDGGRLSSDGFVCASFPHCEMSRPQQNAAPDPAAGVSSIDAMPETPLAPPTETLWAMR
jgi:hypothetical protein